MCRQGMGRRSKPVTQKHNDSAHREVGLGALGEMGFWRKF